MQKYTVITETETVELVDFTEKNTKSIGILKTVGLADFTEKNAKEWKF